MLRRKARGSTTEGGFSLNMSTRSSTAEGGFQLRLRIRCSATKPGFPVGKSARCSTCRSGFPLNLSAKGSTREDGVPLSLGTKCSTVGRGGVALLVVRALEPFGTHNEEGGEGGWVLGQGVRGCGCWGSGVTNAANTHQPGPDVEAVEGWAF